MQGLINFSTEVADGIAVMLPAFCYAMACACFLHAVWTLWTWSDTHSRYSHPHRTRPWVPFVSLALSGVFATFPNFLTMANVSAGTGLAVGLTTYAPTTPAAASSVIGATPEASVLNVVTLFQYFFQAFGAACVFAAIVRWRAITIGRMQGSPTSCGVQFLFGVCLINVVTIATSVAAFFTTSP